VIEVSIERLVGDVALCNALSLYEYEPASGGPQTEEDEELGAQASWPMNFALGQSYPNPLHERTTIAYQLPIESPVSLKIYNVAGQVVRELASGKQKPGYYKASWDGKDGSGRQVSSGIYFYRLDAGGFTKTNKLVVVR
jgi:hypothetical protein